MPGIQHQGYKEDTCRLAHAQRGAGLRVSHTHKQFEGGKRDNATHSRLTAVLFCPILSHEEDAMELFNWRYIEKGKPDTSAAARKEALDRELHALDQGKRRSENGLGFRAPAAAAAGSSAADEYELDEEAEFDGAMVEAQMEEEVKQSRNRGGSARAHREEEEAVEAHLAVATSAPGLPPWNVRKAAAGGSSSSSSSAAAPAAPPARTRSSEDLIDSIDVTSDNERNDEPLPAPSSSARKARAAPTLPLSRVVSSAPAAAASGSSPQRSFPSSFSKSAGPAPSSADVFASFSKLNEAEASQFLASAGRVSSTAMARAFVMAVPDGVVDAIEATLHERSSGE